MINNSKSQYESDNISMFTEVFHSAQSLDKTLTPEDLEIESLVTIFDKCTKEEKRKLMTELMNMDKSYHDDLLDDNAIQDLVMYNSEKKIDFKYFVGKTSVIAFIVAFLIIWIGTRAELVDYMCTNDIRVGGFFELSLSDIYDLIFGKPK